jgi:very-short-patch-repair endonuclease
VGGSSNNQTKAVKKASTDAEWRLWRELRSRQLAEHKFRRRQSLGRFIVDFVCLEARLVVEVHCGQHNQEKQRVHDESGVLGYRKKDSGDSDFGMMKF